MTKESRWTELSGREPRLDREFKDLRHRMGFSKAICVQCVERDAPSRPCRRKDFLLCGQMHGGSVGRGAVELGFSDGAIGGWMRMFSNPAFGVSGALALPLV